MLTLSPDVDFDLDFVNARIRDGTETKLETEIQTVEMKVNTRNQELPNEN